MSQIGFEEYRSHDAVGLAELVARGDVTATDLLDVAIERRDRVNGRINAVVRPMDDIAHARAESELSGPFAGVPFLLKDLMQDYAGLPTGSGSKVTQTLVATEHSEVVRRWLESGLVLFGKTNTPEFGLQSVTEPRVHGPARNPWNTDYTPGGSSGGSAAAVAAGVVPAAGANDGGGSIRIPAACCGLFGLKASRGTVPSGPSGEHLHGAAMDGVVSRSVRDSAALLDVIAGPDRGGPYLAAAPTVPFATQMNTPPDALRIGYVTAAPNGSEIHPEAVAAVEDAVALLRSLGHTAEPAAVDIDHDQLARDFLTMWFAATAAKLDDAGRAGLGSIDDVELDTQMIVIAGREVRASEYVSALERWNTYARGLTAFHDRYDFLLTPTLAFPPVRVGKFTTPESVVRLGSGLVRFGAGSLLTRTGMVERIALQQLSWTPHTPLANVTGRPAMTVPLHWTARGLPLGVQFVGELGSEGRMFALAAQLEDARPWADRCPPL